MHIEIKVLDDRLHDWGLPHYQTDGAAAIDLHACLDQALHLNPQAPAQLVPAGISLFCPDRRMAGLVLPRSGLGHRQGLVLGNAVGLIDADYTGQIFISAWNRNPSGSAPLVIQPGDRIAQLMFVPILRPDLVMVDQHGGQTSRGAGGFGSTGI